jgi:hypothetical protein
VDADAVDARLQAPLEGRGSPLIRAAVAAGVDVQLVANYTGSRALKRALEALAQDRPVLPDLPRPARRPRALTTGRPGAGPPAAAGTGQQAAATATVTVASDVEEAQRDDEDCDAGA